MLTNWKLTSTEIEDEIRNNNKPTQNTFFFEKPVAAAIQPRNLKKIDLSNSYLISTTNTLVVPFNTNV